MSAAKQKSQATNLIDSLQNIIGQKVLPSPAVCLAQPFYAFTNNLKYFHKKCQHMRNAMTSQSDKRPASQQANSVQSNPVQPQSQSQSLPLPAAAAARAGNQSQQPKSFQAKSSRRHRQQRRHRHGKASCRFHEICSKLLNTHSSWA